MQKKAPNNITGFFIYFLRPHYFLAVMLLVVGVLYGVLSTSSNYAIKFIVDAISEIEVRDQAFEYMLMPILLFLVCKIAEVSNYRLAEIVRLKLYPKLRKDIHNYCMNRLNNQSYKFYQDNFSGKIASYVWELTSRYINLVDKADEYFHTLTKLLLTAFFLYLAKPIFALIIVVWALIVIFLSFLYTKKLIYLSEEFAESKARLSGLLMDNLSNIINVFSYSNKKKELKIYNQQIDNTIAKDKALRWKIILMHSLQDIAFVIMTALIFLLLIYYYRNSIISSGDFIMVLTLVMSISPNIWWLANNFTSLLEDIGNSSQAIKNINRPIEIKDQKNAKNIRISKGEIEFKDVTFRFNENKSIFENKNIIIKAGEKIGLVGHTGSGKSTFINLILRFYDPDSGKVIIDKQNIREVKQDSLRKQIALIPQDTTLFHRTIFENINYGDTSSSQRQVLEASKKAHCHEFVTQLPEGYETMVGDRGVKLSGGQKQRIAIARAFLKKAKIIIFDEATSALDSITEKKVQESMDELTNNITTIVIAHRLSTLKKMDRILVLEDGHIIQDGSHEKLSRIDGPYKKLWQTQAGGFLPDDYK